MDDQTVRRLLREKLERAGVADAGGIVQSLTVGVLEHSLAEELPQG